MKGILRSNFDTESHFDTENKQEMFLKKDRKSIRNYGNT